MMDPIEKLRCWAAKGRLMYVPLYQLQLLYRVEGATPDACTRGRNCSKASSQTGV